MLSGTESVNSCGHCQCQLVRFAVPADSAPEVTHMHALHTPEKRFANIRDFAVEPRVIEASP